ncbi:MAG: DUF47 family protein [Candidatus Tectomicrobia bacterium]|nr:DUF47 family protein [Candidatus Tectomicrobia bacterium]
MKVQIIHELGINELLLPKLINDALSANDRTKYFFTLLQMAKNHADHPYEDSSDLKRERQISGIKDTIFDHVVKESRSGEDHTYSIPEARRIFDEIIKSITEMMLPLKAVSQTESGTRFNDEAYEQRFKTLVGVPLMNDDAIPGSFIDMMTSGQREEGDSLHLMVMDLHKDLNKLQAEISKESIDGARVYGITDDDRILIKAFMSGVNNTAKLKFEHPGLGTTATRKDDTLIIQNDIGLTDAHVLVVHIRGLTSTLTYTDIHIERLLFFHSLFEKFDVTWEDTRSKATATLDKSPMYHLSAGVYPAKDQKDLEDYLVFLGSRIVFLVDWNRTRKRLRNFVRKNDCIEILKWAADNNYGHMGFLRLGGEQLIYDAIELISKVPLRYGEQFHEALGRERAVEFLKFVMKTCTEGLLEGKSEFLIRNEVRAELTNYFHSAYQGFLEITANHASLVVEIAMGVRDGILKNRSVDAMGFLRRNARRANKWEKKADNLINKARTLAKRLNDGKVFEELLTASDNAADSLEEAVYLLLLIPRDGISKNMYESLRDLAEHVVQGSQEYLKAVENARYIQSRTSREEMQKDFLKAIDSIITIEHQADDISRSMKAVIMGEARDFKQLYIFSEVSKNIEEGADWLKKAALILRDYVLEIMIK